MTGDGTTYTIPFDTTTLNVGANSATGTGVSGFDVSTNSFVAPVPGILQLYLHAVTSGITTGTGVTNYGFAAVTTASHTYDFTNVELLPIGASNSPEITRSLVVPMIAGEKVSIQFQVSGQSTKLSGLIGASAQNTTLYGIFTPN